MTGLDRHDGSPGLALVVLAAGVGSRFGGLKQLEAVGPGGETLLEYSIFDALRAGFDHIVLVIQPELALLVVFSKKYSTGNETSVAFEAVITIRVASSEAGATQNAIGSGDGGVFSGVVAVASVDSAVSFSAPSRALTV